MKKVSVIIPCYNAVRFLERCVTALINQTIGPENIELIFVNDASTDETYTELCKWEQRYPDNIMVINCEQNGRQGRARNIGLNYAGADYIGYMDVDDYIEPEMYANMYAKAIEHDCDMVVAKSKTYEEDKFGTLSMGKTGKEDSFIVIQNKEEREQLLDMNIGTVVWNKLIKTSILKEHGIFFPERLFYEDICFAELLKHYSNRIYILEEYLYHHIVRSGSSAFHANDPERYLDYLDSFEVEEILLAELIERGIYKEYSIRYERDFILNGYASLLRFYLRTGQTFPYEAFVYMRKRTLELFPKYKENPYISLILKGRAGKSLELLCSSLEQELTPTALLNLASALVGE